MKKCLPLAGATLVLGVLFLTAASAAGDADIALSQVTEALGRGDAVRAETIAEKALVEANPTPVQRARLFLDRGQALFRLGRPDEALAAFAQGIGMHALSATDQANALFDRGVLLDALGRTDDAIADYSAAISLSPRFAMALDNRGDAYRRQAMLPQALADYRAALASGNGKIQYAYYGLGQIAEAVGDWNAARNYYAKALAADSGFGPARGRLAALGIQPQLGDPDAAPIVLHPPPAIKVAVQVKPAAAASHSTASAPARPPHLAPSHKPPRPAPSGKHNSPVLRPAITLVQIQLGAWRNAPDAVAGWKKIMRQASGDLGNLSLHIAPADVPGKGRYFRLRAGPIGRDQGAALCVVLRKKKLDCTVPRD
jgi:tetratricopeptide (TPR) repeat protein